MNKDSDNYLLPIKHSPPSSVLSPKILENLRTILPESQEYQQTPVAKVTWIRLWMPKIKVSQYSMAWLGIIQGWWQTTDKTPGVLPKLWDILLKMKIPESQGFVASTFMLFNSRCCLSKKQVSEICASYVLQPYQTPLKSYNKQYYKKLSGWLLFVAW